VSRPYVRLPDNDELVLLWRENGQSALATAEVIGCSAAAVSRRLHDLGLRRDPVVRAGKSRRAHLTARIVELEARAVAEDALRFALELVVARLAERVTRLEARPLVLPPENHRRIVDGGEGARHARRAAR
jgi:predicted transcriptional regulator